MVESASGVSRPSSAEREPRVVAAGGAVALVGHVHQTAVHRDADRLDPAGRDGAAGAGVSEPPLPTASTEIWLLPASTASTQSPSAVVWIDPCDPMTVPVPAPPAAKGEPAVGVSEPSAC